MLIIGVDVGLAPVLSIIIKVYMSIISVDVGLAPALSIIVNVFMFVISLMALTSDFQIVAPRSGYVLKRLLFYKKKQNRKS